MQKNSDSLVRLRSEQSKNKQFKAQLSSVYEALMVKPMTMKEVDVYTGVMRENICRYVSDLTASGLIAVRKKRRCSITGFPKVNEYTANPELFPADNQLSLF